MGSHVLTGADLPSAVIKATTPMAGSTEDRVEGNAIGMMELTEFVRINQNCLPELCKLLKARLKDADEMVSRISLDVIDQCQQAFGFVFQALVMKNMLKRILIMSEPKSGLGYKLREAACKYLLLWAERYGIDPRLKKFKEAGAEIRKRAAKDEAKEMKALAEAARIAKAADMEELKNQLISQGKSPSMAQRNMGGSGRSLSGSQSGSSSNLFGGSASNLFGASFGKSSGRNLLNAARGPQMNQVATATFQGLKPMVEEHLGMLSALMDGVAPEDVANNYQAEKSARSCTILRNKLEAISESLSSTNNHQGLVECLGITEELTKRLQAYEQIRRQYSVHYGHPVSRTGSARTSNVETSSNYSAADTDRSGIVQGMIYDGASSAPSVPDPSAPPMPLNPSFVPKANQIAPKQGQSSAKDNQIVPKFNAAPAFWSPPSGNAIVPQGSGAPNFHTPPSATAPTPPSATPPARAGSSGNHIVPMAGAQPLWFASGSVPLTREDDTPDEDEGEEDAFGAGPDTDFLKSQLDPALRAQLGLDSGVNEAAQMTAMMAVSERPSPFSATSLPTPVSPESMSPRDSPAATGSVLGYMNMESPGSVSSSTSSASVLAAAAAGVDPTMRKKKMNYDWGECVLTCDTIRVPVRAADGHVYEKWAIEKWLKENNNRSPLTNVQITDKLQILTDKDIPGGAAMLGERHSCPTFDGSQHTI